MNRITQANCVLHVRLIVPAENKTVVISSLAAAWNITNSGPLPVHGLAYDHSQCEIIVARTVEMSGGAREALLQLEQRLNSLLGHTE